MTYASEVLADSPYLWWRLGEPSGTSAADTSGNGRTGTYNGSPTLAVAGAIGGDSDTAVQFDGVNDYVSRADTADLTAFTAEAWVKTTGSSGVIIARDNLNFAQRIFRIALNAGALEGIVWKNGSTLAAVTGPTINNGNWRHVALTYDGTTTRLYLDGSSVGTPSTTVSGALLTNDTAFSVGADAIGTNRFTGTIDEPAYYATALSGARIAAHYAAATPPPPITVHPAKITSIGTVHAPAIVPYVAPTSRRKHQHHRRARTRHQVRRLHPARPQRRDRTRPPHRRSERHMSQRTIIRGTTEYLDVTVRCDFTLSAQPVAFSFDEGANWLTAAWVGTAGTTRTARLLLNTGNTPAGNSVRVYVKVTDSTEIPWLDAGRLNVR